MYIKHIFKKKLSTSENTVLNTYFALQYWQLYFCMTAPTKNIVYILHYLDIKFINLSLKQKLTCVAFSDLY